MGRFGWLGLAATLGQYCPCLIQSPCILFSFHFYPGISKLMFYMRAKLTLLEAPGALKNDEYKKKIDINTNTKLILSLLNILFWQMIFL